MKTLKAEIQSVIDYIDFHKNYCRQIALVTKDSNNKRKLLAGANFIEQIKVFLEEALLSCGDSEQ